MSRFDVLFVAQYGPAAASSRTRVFQYLPVLESSGVRADVQVVIPDALSARSGTRSPLGRAAYYLLSLWHALRVGWRCVRSARSYDVLFIQKVILPFPLPLLLRPHRRKVVYDFDDAIFTLEAPEEGLMARIRAWRRGRALPPMLQAAGHAIVENPYTEAYARQFCPEVSTITGPIDTRHYRPGAREGRAGVVLGWIGSWSTARYLEMIRGPLAEVGRRYPHVRLLLIGARGFHLEGLRVECRPWSLETEVTDLQRIDVGLAPLPDDPWTIGKGGYKLLQYMAVGLPVVASPVGVQRAMVDEGVNGYLVSSHAQWEACLGRLIEDPNLRERMGKAGRDRVVQDFSLERSSLRFEEILRSVACAREQPCGMPSP